MKSNTVVIKNLVKRNAKFICIAVGLATWLTACDSNTTPGKTHTAASEPTTTSTTIADTSSSPTVELPVSVKEIMVGVIEQSSNAIWAIAMDENIPQSEEDWLAVEANAIQLLAATAAIAQGGSGPKDAEWAQQPSWQVMSQEMMRITEEILQAARQRDYDATLDASNFLVEPCSACHTAFPGESAL